MKHYETLLKQTSANLLLDFEYFKILDCGHIDYPKALDLQRFYFKSKVQEKLDQTEARSPNILMLCEHNPVYTLGKSGNPRNLINSNVEAELVKIERGGDITYHGPGQITGYPIFDLEPWGIGLAKYVDTMESAIIQYLESKSIKSSRITKAPGIWLDSGKEKERKICAVGIKASRHITMHGFALNINTNLNWFKNIIPCGLDNQNVTSVEKELGTSQNFGVEKKHLGQAFIKVFEQVVDKT